MLKLFRPLTDKEKTLLSNVKGIIGRKTTNVALYQLAVRHSSVSKDSNERLEFLGDAILGSVVAEFLFKKFPYKDEGFLTEIRSRIVKRDSLNTIAQKIGLDKIIEFNDNKRGVRTASIYGNALEAFIGAVYLDKGYKFSRKFVINQLVKPHINLDELIEQNLNFKSTLIEWAQKGGKKASFEIIEEIGKKHQKQFTSQAVIDGEPIGKGTGFSKKKAEQSAAENACIALGIN